MDDECVSSKDIAVKKNFFKKNETFLEVDKEVNVIPLIVFDEMGLAEISKNKPLKVLHSLLETDNDEVAFIGLSNWRLDASKMNRGVFLARPDLDKQDLETTAEVIYKSYLEEQSNSIDEFSNNKKINLIKSVAFAYYSYKEKLKAYSYSEFHGARDFYHLIKQISEGIVRTNIFSIDAAISIVQKAFERNFQGLGHNNTVDIKKDFKSIYTHEFNFGNDTSTLDLISANLSDLNARYLMLIVKNNSSATFILDNHLRNNFKNKSVTFVGSRFKNDLKEEEYFFRKLSDIIMYMEKGWTIIMQDMEQIYGGLYDLFNQNFTITAGKKKNCRIALGSIINPLCYVHDDFKCIILDNEDMIDQREPPFLNRFEKYYLNFESLLTKLQLNVIYKLKNWIDALLELNVPSQKLYLAKGNVIANYSNESLTSLVIYHYEKLKANNLTDEELEVMLIKCCKECLIKNCSNFAILVSKQSKMASRDKPEQIEFMEQYTKLFKGNSNLMNYLNNLFKQNESFKSVVYTFDNVVKPIELEGEFEQIQIGEINSEKDLNDRITTAYASKKCKLIILRLDAEKDKQHLSLIKFLIDKIELDSAIKKQICLIIHLNFKISIELDQKLNFFNLSYLSGWDQIMMDSLDDKMSDIVDFVNFSLKEILIDKEFIKVEQRINDLILNSLNKFCYVDAENKKDYPIFNDKIKNYKINLLKFFDSSSENELTRNVIKFISEKTMNQIKEKMDDNIEDWTLKIITDSELFKFNFKIKVLLEHLTLSIVEKYFIKVFYSIERYFPFESLFSHGISPDLGKK